MMWKYFTYTLKQAFVTDQVLIMLFMNHVRAGFVFSLIPTYSTLHLQKRHLSTYIDWLLFNVQWQSFMHIQDGNKLANN